MITVVAVDVGCEASPPTAGAGCAEDAVAVAAAAGPFELGACLAEGGEVPGATATAAAVTLRAAGGTALATAPGALETALPALEATAPAVEPAALEAVDAAAPTVAVAALAACPAVLEACAAVAGTDGAGGTFAAGAGGTLAAGVGGAAGALTGGVGTAGVAGTAGAAGAAGGVGAVGVVTVGVFGVGADGTGPAPNALPAAANAAIAATHPIPTFRGLTAETSPKPQNFFATWAATAIGTSLTRFAIGKAALCDRFPPRLGHFQRRAFRVTTNPRASLEG
jgi:hypothetical protein